MSITTTTPEAAASHPTRISVALNRQDIESLLPHRGLALVIDEVIITNQGSAEGYFAIRSDDRRIVDHFGTTPGVLLAELAHLTAAAMMSWSSDEKKRMLPALLTSQIDIMTTKGVFPGDRLICDVEHYSNVWVRFKHFLLLRRRGFASKSVMRQEAKYIFFPSPKTPYIFFRAHVTHKNGERAARVWFTGVKLPLRLLQRNQRQTKEQQ